MPITHHFVSVIPDDPAAVLAGEIVPSEWNAAHDIDFLNIPQYLSIGAAAAQSVGAIRLSQGNLAVAASGTLTVAVQPTAGDTFGGGVYHFVPLGTGAVFGDIELGANLAATKVSIEQQVSAYWGPTVGDSIYAFTGNVATVTARTPGTAGNSISTTTSFTDPANFANAATLSGGLAAAGGIYGRNAANDGDLLLSLLTDDLAYIGHGSNGAAWYIDYTNANNGIGSLNGIAGSPTGFSVLALSGRPTVAADDRDYARASFSTAPTAASSSFGFSSERATALVPDVASPAFNFQGSHWDGVNVNAVIGSISVQPAEFGFPAYLSLYANSVLGLRVGENRVILENRNNGGYGIVGPNTGDTGYANWMTLNNDTLEIGETAHFITLKGLPTSDPMNGKAQLWMDAGAGRVLKVGT